DKMKNKLILFFFFISNLHAQVPNKNSPSISTNKMLANEVIRHPDYSVDKFGAKGDGISDDSKAIQNAINSLCTSNGGMIEFTPGKTYKAGSLIIPNFTAGYMPQFYIRGNGATIISTSDTIMSKLVKNQAD